MTHEQQLGSALQQIDGHCQTPWLHKTEKFAEIWRCAKNPSVHGCCLVLLLLILVHLVIVVLSSPERKSGRVWPLLHFLILATTSQHIPTTGTYSHPQSLQWHSLQCLGRNNWGADDGQWKTTKPCQELLHVQVRKLTAAAEVVPLLAKGAQLQPWVFVCCCSACFNFKSAFQSHYKGT